MTDEPKRHQAVRPSCDPIELDPPVYDGWPRFTAQELAERSKDERYVQDRLKEMGLNSEKVEERKRRKTCDLKAWTEKGPVERYWIEVKTRFTDETLLKALRGEVTPSPLAYSKRLGYSKTSAEILERAVRQLDSSAGNEDEFRVAWLIARSPFDSEIHFEQVIATVFGIQIVTELPISSMKRCYFFDADSIFLAFRNLDAVVVERSEASKICLNPYTPRLEGLRRTKLVASFNTPDVIDPIEEEKAGRGYIVECDSGRPEDVLAFLAEKYGLKKPINFVLQRRGPYAVVPLIPPQEIRSG